MGSPHAKVLSRRKPSTNNGPKKTSAILPDDRSLQAAKVLYPVPYSPGVKEFLAATKGKLIRGLLSSCVDVVGQHAADETEMEFTFCNRVHHRDGVFTGTLNYDVPTWEKHLRIPEICAKYNVTPEEICHIGDNENDLSVFERVGSRSRSTPKRRSRENGQIHHSRLP